MGSICADSQAWPWNPLENVDGPAGAAADRDWWAWTEARPWALGANWHFFISASLDNDWLVLNTCELPFVQRANATRTPPPQPPVLRHL